MPYRNKEDRAKYMREYRQSKKETNTHESGVSLVDLLVTELGFRIASYEDWIDLNRGFKQDEHGIWRDYNQGGKIAFPPIQVLYGDNVTIFIR